MSALLRKSDQADREMLERLKITAGREVSPLPLNLSACITGEHCFIVFSSR